MSVDLYHLADLKEFLQKNGLQAKRSLGQNFLFHKKECEKIIQAAGIRKGDKVLEIGPGLGHLTMLMEEAGAEVTACEIDRRLTDLWPELHPNFKGKLLQADFLETSPEEYGRCTKVVANLPYYIVKEIILKLLTCGVEWESLTFTLQKEEVARLTKKQGEERYGALNALLLILGGPDCAGVIKKDNFYPRPNIDSAILRIAPILWPEYTLWQKTLKVVKAAFARRRKLLKSNLAELNVPGEAFSKLGISELARAEELDPKLFLDLARFLPE